MTGVAVCIVISALDVTSPLVAVDEDDSDESGVAARPANTRGLDSQVVVRDGSFTTTSLPAMVLLGSTFFDTAVGEDTDGLAITLADTDDSPPVINVVRGVASSPLVSPVLCGEVDVRRCSYQTTLEMSIRLRGSAVLTVLSRRSSPRWRWTGGHLRYRRS